MLYHRPTVLLLATSLLQYNLEGKRRLEENTGGDNDNLEKESWLLKDGSFQQLHSTTYTTTSCLCKGQWPKKDRCETVVTWELCTICSRVARYVKLYCYFKDTEKRWDTQVQISSTDLQAHFYGYCIVKTGHFEAFGNYSPPDDKMKMFN